MPDRNPYAPPQSPAQIQTLQTTQRSTSRIIALVSLATFVAIGVTPGLCALAWLLGYGNGGMHELLTGYPITGMLKCSIMFCPIHYLGLVLPQKRTPKMIGYAASAVAVLSLALYWFISAAVIANV